MASYVYEYFWDITFSIPNRNISFKPYAITFFQKECNYFTDFIPSYKLKCKIEEKYLNILRFMDKEFVVLIKQYMLSGVAKGSYSDKELISEQEFVVYYDKEQIPSYMKTNKIVSDSLTAIDTIKTNDSPGALSTHELTFQLLLKKDMLMKTYIHNYVFGSEDNPTDPITAVMGIIEQNPYIEKCIIDKPDNTEAYENMIIECAELKDAIKNVQFNYGLYSKGLLLFFDDGILYVLNKCNSEHAYTKDDINLVQVLVDERSDQPNAKDNVLVDTKNGLIGYERLSKVFKEDYESIEGITTGNKFVYSNFDSIVGSTTSKDKEISYDSPLQEVVKPRPSRVDIGAKIIVDYDMLNNPFNMSSLMAEKSIGVPITIGLQNVNVNHFRANKMVKLNFDTPESKKLYSGLYNIKSATFYYTGTSNPSMRYNTHGSVLLTLCNKTEGFDKDYEPVVV